MELKAYPAIKRKADNLEELVLRMRKGCEKKDSSSLLIMIAIFMTMALAVCRDTINDFVARDASLSRLFSSFCAKPSVEKSQPSQPSQKSKQQLHSKPRTKSRGHAVATHHQ